MDMQKRNMASDARKKFAAFAARHRDLLLGAVLWTAIILIEAVVALYDIRVYSVPSGFWPFFFRRMLLPTIPFLIIFAVHDFLLAPMLVNRKKAVPYLICTLALLGFFSAYILCFDSPGRPRRIEPEHFNPELPDTEHFENRRPPEPPEPREWDGERKEPPMKGDSGVKEPPGRRAEGTHPMDPEIFKIFLAAMMLAANLGWKYYISYSREKHRLEKLEKENLQYRLESLRYQISPHFFMNTLNNIHALVDLSPEKAKESIVELSRLMRHVLYDSSAPTADLSREIDFLRHYIYLMRLRYTENVRIDCKFPDGPVTAQVPPLLMSTIVENAFKHGVSSGGESFISVSVSVESGKVVFRCVNSLAPGAGDPGIGGPEAGRPWAGGKPSPSSGLGLRDEAQNAAKRSAGEVSGREVSGGVGLENIEKRLSLLYGDRYLLHIERKEKEYDVLIVLPVEPETDGGDTRNGRE